MESGNICRLAAATRRPARSEGASARRRHSLSVGSNAGVFAAGTRLSTRQCCRIEIAASRSKQTIGAQSTRQFFGEPSGAFFEFRFSKFVRGGLFPASIFKFPISNFASRNAEKGVNQNQVFAPATHSKQTLYLRKGCQLFAMVFRGSELQLRHDRFLDSLGLQPLRSHHDRLGAQQNPEANDAREN